MVVESLINVTVKGFVIDENGNIEVFSSLKTANTYVKLNPDR